jgi:hypothetical protein
LEPQLRLEPHRRYVLKIDFAHPEFVGALKILGPRTSRAYWLPDSAYDTHPVTPAQAFAALPGRPHSITLWTDGDVPEVVGLYFFFSGEGPGFEVQSFGHFKLLEFDPAQLPVRIESLAPYRATVTTSVAAYLETPRMFLDGYAARVNGHPAKVVRSPSALVMVPLAAGENHVELSYPGPWPLRGAYFFSLGAWFVLLAAWICSLRCRAGAAALAGT